MYDDFLGGINMQVREQQEHMQRIVQDISNKNRQREEREVKNSINLEEIKNNTAALSNIVSLIRNSNEKQEQIYNLFVEMFEVVKSGNKDEAEGIFEKVLDKSSKLKNGIETFNTLYTYGKLLLSLAFPETNINIP